MPLRWPEAGWTRSAASDTDSRSIGQEAVAGSRPIASRRTWQSERQQRAVQPTVRLIRSGAAGHEGALEVGTPNVSNAAYTGHSPIGARSLTGFSARSACPCSRARNDESNSMVLRPWWASIQEGGAAAPQLRTARASDACPAKLQTYIRFGIIAS